MMMERSFLHLIFDALRWQRNSQIGLEQKVTGMQQDIDKLRDAVDRLKSSVAGRIHQSNDLAQAHSATLFEKDMQITALSSQLSDYLAQRERVNEIVNDIEAQINALSQ